MPQSKALEGVCHKPVDGSGNILIKIHAAEMLQDYFSPVNSHNYKIRMKNPVAYSELRLVSVRNTEFLQQVSDKLFGLASYENAVSSFVAESILPVRFAALGAAGPVILLRGEDNPGQIQSRR